MNAMRPLSTAFAVTLAIAASSVEAAPLPAGSVYVALGSSFAAGPGVTQPAADGPTVCRQSADNYPRQLARALDLRLVDRSCGGATTVDVLKGGQFGLPAQIDALAADTALVTMTIGGNDVRYMADLGVASCRLHPEGIPATLRERFCSVPPGFDLEQAFDTTARNLATIVEQIRHRSPRARIVFVDYVTVLPKGPPCARTPISAQDSEVLRGRAERLASLTADVAARSNVEILKASRLTQDHDACATDPWVEGGLALPDPNKGAGAPYHPRLAGMTAVAEALVKILKQ